ncbi:alpha/beta-gliadin clone PW8142-like [Phoenix dactylifera]|uniref:Alpha/beta-gliadin clone PW8142-like n=1 Tax=Phoenix dactylifera TaxID=42345 RepID=A0A8B9B3I4_PHODC|nr:alpha/beta-gliadin clone PW8142-like [Phoenix dactylifera]
MARGRGRGRARRPTRFADGSTAWAPSGQQEDTSSTPTRSVPQQEHTMDPTGSTPEMGAPEIGTSEGPSIQLEETISASQLMQMMVQQQAAAREDMMRMVEVQQQFLQQQLQQQQAMYQQQQQQQFQGTTAQPEHRVSLLDFQRYAPPAFKGTADPMEAVSWLKQMEKVFQALRCPDEEKVLFATFMLQGEAADWWEMEKREAWSG